MTDRSVVVRLRLNISDFSKGTAEAAVESRVLRAELEGVDKRMGSVEKSSSGAGKEIDKLSGRIAILGHLAGALGPALIPIGAVGIPAVAGLTEQLGFAVLAGGTLLASLHGVGDGVKALEKARLDPTAENLQAAQEAMAKLGPDAQEFALHLQATLPMLRDIRDAGAAGWFPGLTDAIDTLSTRGPQVADIFEKIGRAGGKLASEGADALAGHEWDDFFNFLETEGPHAVSELGHSVGSLTHGLAQLWMAMDPLSDDFTAGLARNADRFDDWATKLDGTRGYEEFVDYIRETGPEVLDFLGSTANMLLQIVEAASPLGGPTLKILGDVADILAKIADSDLGTPLVGLASMYSTLRLLERASGGLTPRFTSLSTSAKTFGQDVRVAAFGSYDEMERARTAAGRLGGQFKTLGKNAAVMGGITLAASGVTDGIGLTNTTMLGMTGLMMGPWGAAVGTGVGLLLDLNDAANATQESLARIGDVIGSNDLADMEKLRAELQTKADSWQGKLDWKGAGTQAAQGVAELDEAIARLKGGQKVAGMGALFRETLAGGIDHADQSLRQFSHSFEHLNGLLAKRGSLIAYEQALDDLSASIKDNGNAWDFGTEKGRLNIQAADTLTQQAIARSNLLKRAGNNEGAQAVLDRTIRALKAVASTSKSADARLAPLINHLEALDKKKPKPTADLDSKPLKHKTDQADAWLDSLDKRKANPSLGADDDELQHKGHTGLDLLHMIDGFTANPKVRADTSGLFSVFGAIQQAMHNIDGMVATTTVRTVHTGGPGPQPKATGGLLSGPGGPTDDRIPVMGSNGEYVVRAAAVDHYGVGFFDQANAMRLASGGSITNTRWDSGQAAGAAHAIVREREVLPDTIVLDAGDLGLLVFKTATGAAELVVARQDQFAEDVR